MEQLNQEITGDPQEVAHVTIRPVARLSGFYWQSPDARSAAGLVHLSPTEVIVQNGDDEVHLPLPIPTKDILFSQLQGIVAISVGALVVITGTQIWARWRS